jgi:hypothetical protein
MYVFMASHSSKSRCTVVHSKQRLEDEMRTLVEDGQSLDEALRTMFRKGYGKLLLFEPVISIAHVDSPEAKRIVIRAIGMIDGSGPRKG